MAERVFYLAHQPFEQLGRGGPLTLLGGELVGGLADLLNGAVNLVRRRFLLLGGQDRFLRHRQRRRHQLADLAGVPGALLGGHDRRVRFVLDPADDQADRVGRANRPFGEFAHLGGNDRESLARLARPGGFDGRVQRQQVGLPGEVVDQFEDLADLLRPLAQGQRALRDRVDLLLHVSHVVAGAGRGVGDGVHVVGDRPGGRSQLLDRRGRSGRRPRIARWSPRPRSWPPIAVPRTRSRGRSTSIAAGRAARRDRSAAERLRQFFLAPVRAPEQPGREPGEGRPDDDHHHPGDDGRDSRATLGRDAG